MKQKKHYVNNKDFYEALVEFKAKQKVNPDTRIPNYIGLCIQSICDKLSTKYNFVGYTFRDEMVSDGIENCIAAIDQFNPSKSVNAFAYFTQIAWNAFIRRILKEQKQTYIKHKNMQTYMLVGNMLDGDNDKHTQLQNNDLSNGIISNFENKLTKPKKHAKIGIEEFACDTIEDMKNEPK